MLKSMGKPIFGSSNIETPGPIFQSFGTFGTFDYVGDNIFHANYVT